MLKKPGQYQFLLDKRDFKKKYKRTVIGKAWSIPSRLASISPSRRFPATVTPVSWLSRSASCTAR